MKNLPNIVTIGGGTGSFTTLKGLKKYPFNISAVVNTFDSGGSSGILRDEYGILPPGDIRRCLIALADEESESTLRELFNYRFDKDGTLKGHNFGNLFLTALTQISSNYPEAITKASTILNCKGNIYPVSLDNAHVCAELENGEVIKGETNIDVPKHDPFLKIKKVFLEPSVSIHENTKKALIEADVIVFCPGDIYTSIIPNLLVEGFAEALKESKAKKVYICNLMTKLGETHGFKASDFAKEILSYSGLDSFDYIICNEKIISKEQLELYAEENKYPVELDDELINYTKNIIKADMFKGVDMVRHDSDKIAELISQINNTKVFIFDLDDTLFDSSGRDSSDEEYFNIKPFDGVLDIISKIDGHIILVTRGEKERQTKKIKVLGLESLFHNIYIVEADNGKFETFKEIAEIHKGKELIVIGNRIDCELRYGKMLGSKTIYVKHGKYSKLEPVDEFEIADVVIDRFDEIVNHLN
jgi:uncharacterized cofD-like protein